MSQEIIEREELMRRLNSGEDFKLVMVLNAWAYRAKHIPGSLHFATPEEVLHALGKDEQIVVYCSGTPCMANLWAQRFLQARGFRHVRRYAGGLTDWEAAGYPLEGELVEEHSVSTLGELDKT